MPKQNEPKVENKEPKGWYKGYEVKWLKENPEHPEFNLVAEYEALNKE